MPKFPIVSGKQAIRILELLGCWRVKQEGSHVRLRHIEAGRELNGTIPLHDELDIKTLFSALRQLEIDRDEFVKVLKEK